MRMDAQTLFQQGVAAIRQENDRAKGRRLLQQSLQLEADNSSAWLWLARTERDPRRQLQWVERALKVDPTNKAARTVRERLQVRLQAQDNARPPTPAPPVSPDSPVAGRQEALKLAGVQGRKIDRLMETAQGLLELEDVEGAIEQWVSVLQLQPDHIEALQNAVRNLLKLKYEDDARELVKRALDSGTTHPSIYLTALDFAKRKSDHWEPDDLRQRLVALPETNEAIVLRIAEEYASSGRADRAIATLEGVLDRFPSSQKILTQLATLHDEARRSTEARHYFNMAAQLGVATREGREADKKLAEYAPVLTDRERGSLALAWREALGFATLYTLLAWQDAGLNLLALGLSRWTGILLALGGGYLVISGTSSPQQQPLAAWLGGEVPDAEESPTDDPSIVSTALPIIPMALRIIMGITGGVLLLAALQLVLGDSLPLLRDPPAPFVPDFSDF
jgi:tetratricopeptide (TPR) repeat protein